jgi:hypothetical protein
LAGFGAHFALLLLVSAREVTALTSRGYTILPPLLVHAAAAAEPAFASALAEPFSRNNPWRQALRTYLNCAGIESGYGFFAPNVPDSYSLVFELHFPDGRVEYDRAGFDSDEGRLRLGTLLDQVGETSSDAMREIMMKLLAHSIWQHHPEAVKVRAIFGSRNVPSPEEVQRGAKESYEFLYAYDFVLAQPEQ